MRRCAARQGFTTAAGGIPRLICASVNDVTLARCQSSRLLSVPSSFSSPSFLAFTIFGELSAVLGMAYLVSGSLMLGRRTSIRSTDSRGPQRRDTVGHMTRKVISGPRPEIVQAPVKREITLVLPPGHPYLGRWAAAGSLSVVTYRGAVAQTMSES